MIRLTDGAADYIITNGTPGNPAAGCRPRFGADVTAASSIACSSAAGLLCEGGRRAPISLY